MHKNYFEQWAEYHRQILMRYELPYYQQMFNGLNSYPCYLFPLSLQQQQLKTINKTKNWIDEIPILVGIDEFESIETCSICLLELNQNNIIKILRCNHFFHEECINQCLKRKAECPICRDQIHK